ncbi:MAG: YceI family protein [Opitutaceae bacterium]
MKIFNAGSLIVAFVAANLTSFAAGRNLTVDKAASHVDIAVKATIDSFNAKLIDFTSSIQIDPETEIVKGAKVSFHFADVKTGNDKRDHEMNMWQKTDQFPDGAFELSTLTAASDHKFTARGSLILHGVAHALEFPVTIRREGALTSVDGEAAVDTRWFGLPLIRKFALLKVDPLIVVRFHLSGTIAGQ